ncbi:hypothetical protein [Candidatus Palauibacter sp.]|uniref:hypothetical protein n=1 Tax=Candidatus Palauibacter sp. TaxID=3101350 RepID=UPI003AF2B736
MTKLRSVLCAVILLAATAAQGVGQVLSGPLGPVEFIGLERWKAPELLEAIQRIAPDQPLHACAATMKSELGFPDAAVFGHFDAESPELIMSGDAELYTVVVGVEDSARVRFRTAGSETIALPEPWQALKSVVEDNFGTLVLAAQMFHSRHDPESVRQVTDLMGMDPAVLDPIWERLESMDGEADRRLAHEVLTRAASWSSRATAAAVLVNFSDHDAVWHDLMSTMIDPQQRVQGVAEAVLKGFIATERVPPVRWAPAREPLMALLDGTNLFAFPTVLKVLTATRMEPEFGRQLIRAAPDLVLAYVGAEHEGTRESAVEFLETVSGEDFGPDREAWSEWLNSPPEGS